MTNCGRCLSLKGEVRKGFIPVVGPNGITDHVCKQCYEEITYQYINENEENENVY